MIKGVRSYLALSIVLICFSVTGYGDATTKLSLSSLSPGQAVAGTGSIVLTLNGSSFKRGMQVQFGSALLLPSYLDSKLIRVTVPATAINKAGEVAVKVVKLDPQSAESNTKIFYVNNPVPSISEITPSSVTAAIFDGQQTKITILGARFVDGALVNVKSGDLSLGTLTATSIQPDVIAVSLPGSAMEKAGTIQISVTNPPQGGGTSNVLNLVVRGRVAATWKTVANNKTAIPETTRLFNSYNQPSVNARGLVVFKGQSKGESGPTVGIYSRDMSFDDAKPIAKIADNSMAVPQPNNTQYNGEPATFIQFPSFPRIDKSSDTIAFRGQSQPVWNYILDGTDTRIGSTGIFSNPSGPLATGVNLLGVVSGFEYFEVPGAPAGTRFDQFPGSPAVADGAKIVFKGNYTVDSVGKTGVFYRDMSAGSGAAPVELIADSSISIPDSTVLFGSTAPPSASDGHLAFVGLDNEDAPSLGGIYVAPLSPRPDLTPIVRIGSQVPGEVAGTTFNKLGEGLSFDGRYVAFWGAWGSGEKARLLRCPTDGNTSVLAACNAMYPHGYVARVPIQQGIFVYDLSEGTLVPVAKSSGEFDDFVYWVFSGRPPSTGDSDGGDVAEPPRWRSSSFIAVAGHSSNLFDVAFKAQIGTTDGIYFAQGPEPSPILTVLDTAMPGWSVDSQSPEGSSIVTLGLERDSHRENWLVVTASMLDPVTTESNAGVYVTPVAMQ